MAVAAVALNTVACLGAPSTYKTTADDKLWSAVENDDVDGLRRELHRNPGFDWHGSDGASVVFQAATNRSVDVLKFALQHRACLDGADATGETSLMAAQSMAAPGDLGPAQWREDVRKSIICTRLLCDAGINVNERDDQGSTALHLAASMGMPKSAEVLLDHGANPNIKDKNGNTPLYTALVFDMYPNDRAILQMCDLLLSHGADVNRRNDIGETPLRGLLNQVSDGTPCYDKKLVLYLLKHHASPNIPDKFGIYPLMFAVEGDDMSLSRLLIHYGSNVNACDKSGRSVLGYAAIGLSKPVHIPQSTLDNGMESVSFTMEFTGPNAATEQNNYELSRAKRNPLWTFLVNRGAKWHRGNGPSTNIR